MNSDAKRPPRLLPEEIQALLEMLPHKGGPAAISADVAQRDFARPNRISTEQRSTVFGLIARNLPDVERAIQASLRQRFELELAEVGEANSESLFAGLQPPFAIARFEVAGHPGWIVWDIAAAVAAVEVALGTIEVKDTKPRKLSTVEKTMLKRLLGAVVQKLAPLCALEPKNLRVIDIVEEIGSWRDGGAQADAQRLAVHLAVHGPGGDSLMRLYLPGFAPAKGARRAELPKHAPEHLAAVPFEVSARLGSAEIPLADLLGLEVGDVIPLGAPANEPLRLMVEDRVCAEATLGSKDGNLAVRIAFLRPPGRED